MFIILNKYKLYKTPEISEKLGKIELHVKNRYNCPQSKMNSLLTYKPKSKTTRETF